MALCKENCHYIAKNQNSLQCYLQLSNTIKLYKNRKYKIWRLKYTPHGSVNNCLRSMLRIDFIASALVLAQMNDFMKVCLYYPYVAGKDLTETMQRITYSTVRS